MKKIDLKSVFAVATALALCLCILAGCASPADSPSNLPESITPSTPAPDNTAPDNTADDGAQLADGGVLLLKVNPEIAITYDADGNVTKIDARNEDAKAIIANYTDYVGKECKTVVSELVSVIGEAGYFVEDIDGERRQITIEIEAGSLLPADTFLDDVANEVRARVSSSNWTNPVDVRGESDYGITDYVDTDYGPNSDGYTDYNDTDYGPNNDGITDYTDYGVAPSTTPSTTPSTVPATGHTDYGRTDYNDTDYGPNNDGVTDYTDYGTAPSPTPTPTPAPTVAPTVGHTDYGRTDYNTTDYGTTDYNTTDYGNSNYGDSGYGR